MGSEHASGADGRRSAASGEEVYQGLRAQILGLDPASAGLAQGPEHQVLWGALMETGYPRGTATLMALADGTTSLYLSTGGGVIGGGFHDAVATAARSFLSELERHLAALRPDPDARCQPSAGSSSAPSRTQRGCRPRHPRTTSAMAGTSYRRCSTRRTESSPN
jgi:hypothetical protein